MGYVRGIISIVIGGACIVGSLSGQIQFRGSDNPMVGAGVGALILVIGVARLISASKQAK